MTEQPSIPLPLRRPTLADYQVPHPCRSPGESCRDCEKARAHHADATSRFDSALTSRVGSAPGYEEDEQMVVLQLAVAPIRAGEDTVIDALADRGVGLALDGVEWRALCRGLAELRANSNLDAAAKMALVKLETAFLRTTGRHLYASTSSARASEMNMLLRGGQAERMGVVS